MKTKAYKSTWSIGHIYPRLGTKNFFVCKFYVSFATSGSKTTSAMKCYQVSLNICYRFIENELSDILNSKLGINKSFYEHFNTILGNRGALL